MHAIKRYNPLLIVFDFWHMIKNIFFPILFLFILNKGTDSTFIKYGRLAFYLFVIVSIISIILKWISHKYKLDDSSFHLYKGFFSKIERTIPFSKVQNVQRRTTFLHKLFKVTSITFETGMKGVDSSIVFEVVNKIEADQIEEHVKNSQTKSSLIYDSLDIEDVPSNFTPEKIIHFKPSKSDILKASFTSLSFLFIIPLIASLFFKLNQVFNIEDKAGGFLQEILRSWWFILIVGVVLFIASITFGIVRAFLKYGKYEISSDSLSVYIKKGVLDESVFTIKKDRVQAIEITQSPMKRILGLAEIKLISVGGIGELSLDTNSLYPFLPVKRAYEMIHELLPSYEVTETMNKLPNKSFWVRLLKPSWLWIIVTVGLVYFKPVIFNTEKAWWILSAGLLFLIASSRVLDYINTRYVLNGKFIQFKTGILETSTFISKRDKIVEISVSRNKLQQILGLASIETINQAKPVHHASISDIPHEMAVEFYSWYYQRLDDVNIE